MQVVGCLTLYLILLHGIKMKITGHTLEKKNEISKFHENPCSGNGVVPCGRTNRQTDVQTEKTKLMFAFRNLSNEISACKFLPPDKFVFWKLCIFLFGGKEFRSV